MPEVARIVPVACVVAVLIAGAGCGDRLQRTLGLPNQPPEAQLSSTLASSPDDASVSHRLSWTASDPDGRVDHFLIAEDPVSDDPAAVGWAATAERTRVLSFRRVPLGAASPTDRPARDFRVFAVRAVDDRGALSVPVRRAFFGDNVAPSVQIVSPRSSSASQTYVPPSFTIRWLGSDPDGARSLPAEYRFRLFQADRGDPVGAWLADPDSLTRTYAPTFAGWDSLRGDAIETQLSNLSAEDDYLFVITALDHRGAYDPVFSLDKNMLLFRVGGTPGPGVTIYRAGAFSYYRYPGGVWERDRLNVELAAGATVVLDWFGTPFAGGSITGYRWALDLANLSDETRRHGPSDFNHWSEWSLASTSATLGPFPDPGPGVVGSHRLFVEARTSNGFISVAWAQISVVSMTFNRELLIVDDTRLMPDFRVSSPPASSPDSLQAPRGPWPTAAELDTFLYAVGGGRWRMTPPGVLSPAGVFRGYRYDTVGTRRGLAVPTSQLSLEFLGHYRHIIWMVEGLGSLYSPEGGYEGPTGPRFPMTTLRWMSYPGRNRTLGDWVAAGGRLWAMGGGFGNASSAPYNNRANDTPAERVYSSQGAGADLVPGHFMYDLAHWRSAFTAKFGLAGVRVERSPFPIGGWEGAPSYALLPAELRPRSPATDPLPPYRGSSFYTQYVDLEYLSLPNEILEAKNPSPRHQHDIQALDTLFVASGAALPVPGPNPAVDRMVNPCMTYYHGVENGPVVFSGFGIWSFARPDCVRLVDAVLQGIWGLSRESGTTVSGVRQAPRQPPRPPGPVSVRARR